MYRIDGNYDRIINRITETDNAINKQRELSVNLQDLTLLILLKDFDKKETQQRIHRLIRSGTSKQLQVVIRTIDKRLDEERATKNKGIACHLLGGLLNNLLHSNNLWRNIISMTADPEAVNDLNKLLKRQIVMNRMSTVIEEYFKTLCQVEDEFFVDVQAVTDKKKLSLFTSIEVPQMIVIIHHLLSYTDTSQFFQEKIYKAFDLSPAFIKYLKLCLRNLNM